MKSLKAAIADAITSHKITAAQSHSVRAMAAAVGLATPFSLSVLIRRLQPEMVVLKSGPLGPSTVTASAELTLLSDGTWWFKGSIHNSGGLGENYLYSIALDFSDASGNHLAFVNTGEVGGLVDARSRDDSWDQANFDQRIADQWDVIKNTGFNDLCHVSTDAISVLETVIGGRLRGDRRRPRRHHHRFARALALLYVHRRDNGRTSAALRTRPELERLAAVEALRVRTLENRLDVDER
jgi:hypothetical protein